MRNEIRRAAVLLLCFQLIAPISPVAAQAAPPEEVLPGTVITTGVPEPSEPAADATRPDGEAKETTDEPKEDKVGADQSNKCPANRCQNEKCRDSLQQECANLEKQRQADLKVRCRDRQRAGEPLSYDCAGVVKNDWLISMNIGQPAVWSLAQAHYLLAEVHHASRELQTRLPSQTELDPNRANAARLEIIRTLLGLEAQFDESVGAKNRIEMEKFRDRQELQVQARSELPARRAELRQVERDLLDLKRREAALKADDQAADAARGTNPLSAADRARKAEIIDLGLQIEHKTAEKDRLAAEIETLEGTASGNLETPPLATVGLTTAGTDTTGAFPESPALKDFVTQALTKIGETSPSLGATMALDNYLGMQYEIVAKQLTLLRDEVGPDEKVIFLELPSSIYTADEWTNGYVAQVEWRVTRYFDQEPSDNAKVKVAKEAIKNETSSKSMYQELKRSLDREAKIAAGKTRKGSSGERQEGGRRYPVTLDMVIAAEKDARDLDQTTATWVDTPEEDVDVAEVRNCRNEAPRMDRRCVRTLEIIPRQSALNVNEYHASTRNRNLLGIFKLLTGFGAKVNFQQQREQYDSFLQQEIFASGFGKGSNHFGWIFGPLPGSKRIAPGQRTTYAVLAVPRDTLALEIEAIGRAFRREASPERGRIVGRNRFIVRVPGERTEELWVDSIAYVPVVAGRGSVTALITGDYFSPQLGVLVNGVPLKRVRSIARIGGKEEARPESTRIEGEFEIPNSHEMVLSFSMPAGFVGAPIITLVTPERSTNINFFKLKVNFQRQRRSLRAASELEPMFIESFKLKDSLEKIAADRIGCHQDLAVYRLNGTGLRPKATVWVDDAKLKTYDYRSSFFRRCKAAKLAQGIALQESTSSYLLVVNPPSEDKPWKVRYRQSNRQGLDEGFAEFQPKAKAGFSYELRHYRFNARDREAHLDLTFSIPEKLPPSVCLGDGIKGHCGRQESDATTNCGFGEEDQNGAYRIRCVVNAEEDGTEREFVSLRLETPPVKKEEDKKDEKEKKGKVSAPAEDPTQPPAQAPNKAPDAAPGEDGKKVEKPTVRFVDVKVTVRPQVNRVADERTDKPEGRSNAEARAALVGVNLTRVTGVLFGDLAAPLAQEASSTLLVVKIPKVDVPAGERRVVPVTIQTEGGALSTGFHYTYIGPDPPKKEKPKKVAEMKE